MARIRSIKPEFWDSPGTAKASLRARLLFIAMWNWADDWGVGDANPKRLLGFAFPSDGDSAVEPRNFRHLAAEVADCFDVCWYEVAGREYYSIPSWEEHQRTEKRAKQLNPGPDQAERYLYEAVSENPPLNRGSSGVGTGEQGNRGTGVKNTSAPAVLVSEFDTAWEHWPKKTERKAAVEQFARAAKKIPAPALVEAIVRFGDAYAATTERQFTPALAVWLRHERWDDDLPQSRQATKPATVIDYARSVADELREMEAWNARQ